MGRKKESRKSIADSRSGGVGSNDDTSGSKPDVLGTPSSSKSRSRLSMLSPMAGRFVEDAKRLVKMEFSTIRRNFEQGELLELRKSFFEAQETLPKKRYQTMDGSVPVGLSMVPDPNLTVFAEKSKVSNKTMTAAQYAGVRRLKTSHGILPRMKYFVHTERNVMGPDNLRLSHIPYVSDSFDQEEEFLLELREAYTEGIHGADLGCGEYINNQMMYKLLESTMDKWDEDISYLHQAIFELFPNKFSLKELEEDIFFSLKERFHPTPPFNPSNIDERYSSISTMFCSKCNIYDCEFHPFVEPEAEEEVIKVSVLPQIDSTGAACGEHCFKKEVITEKSEEMKDLPAFLNQILVVNLQQKSIDVCRLAKKMNYLCWENDLSKKDCREWHALVVEKLGKLQLQEGKQKQLSNREKYRKLKTLLSEIENVHQRVDCSHEGSCGKNENCHCFSSGSACTKYCKCDSNCPIRFPGCDCAPGMCATYACPCFLAKWECDPDRCVKCVCDPVTAAREPVNAKATADSMKICKNISLQRRLQKRIKVGVSCIAGYGCFADEDIEKGELISEYTGEVISHLESERRGRIYDRLNLSYVFSLNKDQCIDACRIGNLIRFANHQDNNPNSEGRIMMVNGEQRVGIYARRRIPKGEELFFNYNYSDNAQQYVAIKAQTQRKKRGAPAKSTVAE